MSAAPKRFYSATSRGFFSSDIHANLPSDAVEITDTQWTALLTAQSAGKQIVPDANGQPIAVDPDPPTIAP